MLRSFIVVLICSVFFAACSTSQKITKIPPAVTDVVSDYKIGVGDNLSILVWKSPEFTTNVPVRPDGKISLPLVGDILALGKTPITLAEDVTVKLSTYVRSPQVTVTVVGVDSAQYLARVSVTGAVNRPVSVPYKKGMTVLDLVLDAGGLTIYAQGNKAKLYRKVDGKVEAFPVNVDDIIKKGNIETNYNLAPTDILTIPESTF